MLYGANLLAERPADDPRPAAACGRSCSSRSAICGLVVLEPDLGTAMVTAFSVAALLIAAGAKIRHLAMIAGALLLLDRDRGPDRAVPDGPPDQLHQPRRGRCRRRVPGPAGLDRARFGRDLRRRHRRERPEGLLPARGPHRHDRRGHRRGARPDRDLAARRPLHAVRLRRVSAPPRRRGIATVACSPPD